MVSPLLFQPSCILSTLCLSTQVSKVNTKACDALLASLASRLCIFTYISDRPRSACVIHPRPTLCRLPHPVLRVLRELSAVIVRALAFILILPESVIEMSELMVYMHAAYLYNSS
jgi:hypothetical protein